MGGKGAPRMGKGRRGGGRRAAARSAARRTSRDPSDTGVAPSSRQGRALVGALSKMVRGHRLWSWPPRGRRAGVQRTAAIEAKIDHISDSDCNSPAGAKVICQGLGEDCEGPRVI